ncbi:MAG: PASTA domain-containing protein, partial [Eubacteriales bacterium]
ATTDTTTDATTDTTTVGDLVVVPDFTGMSVADAEAAMGNLVGLWYFPDTIKTTVESDIEAGFIAAQSVVGEVSKDAALAITFGISAGAGVSLNPGTVEIPSYVGQDRYEVANAIGMLLQGYEYEITYVEQSSSTAVYGEVLSQNITGSVSTDSKISIELTVSTGASTSMEMPSYVGMSITDALAQFASDFPTAPTPLLRYGYSEDIAYDAVYSQSVTGEIYAGWGDQIYLNVSLGSYEPQKLWSGSLDGSGLGVNIAVDGYFSDWSGLPFIYDMPEEWSDEEYWTERGYSIDSTNEFLGVLPGSTLVLESGLYDSNVRNTIGFVTDDEYVYVRLEIATIEDGHRISGNDFMFDLTAQSNFDQVNNDLLAQFFIPELMSSPNYPANSIQELYITHGTDKNESEDVNQTEPITGAVAYLVVDEFGDHSALELKIPISALLYQVGLEEGTTYTGISFQTRQHMVKTITCAGASTGPIIFAILAFIGVSCTYFVTKKNKENSQEKTA